MEQGTKSRAHTRREILNSDCEWKIEKKKIPYEFYKHKLGFKLLFKQPNKIQIKVLKYAKACTYSQAEANAKPLWRNLPSIKAWKLP